MGLPYIGSADKLKQALHYWQEYSFIETDGYLSLNDVIKSLGSDDPMVEVRQEYPARWVLCPTGQKNTKPAILHTAAIWRWNSDLETGNYVPAGEIAPAKLAESRVQTMPSSLCQFSYAFDTRHDKTLWDAQRAFEEFAQATPGFNKGNKLRRTWQDGHDVSATAYVMSAQMFFKRTRFTSKKEMSVSYTLHPWISQATKTTSYFANPDRPTFFEPFKGELRGIEECDPDHIRTGDLVWISFFAEFIIGLNNWSTTFTPYEIVRVASVAPELVGDTSGTDEVDEPRRGGLKAGHKIVPNLSKQGGTRKLAAGRSVQASKGGPKGAPKTGIALFLDVDADEDHVQESQGNRPVSKPGSSGPISEDDWTDVTSDQSKDDGMYIDNADPADPDEHVESPVHVAGRCGYMNADNTSSPAHSDSSALSTSISDVTFTEDEGSPPSTLASIGRPTVKAGAMLTGQPVVQPTSQDVVMDSLDRSVIETSSPSTYGDGDNAISPFKKGKKRIVNDTANNPRSRDDGLDSTERVTRSRIRAAGPGL